MNLPSDHRLTVVLMLLISSVASAQTVYRCGPAGNQYSQLPCPEGKAVDVSDQRSAEQTSQARQTVREQQRLGAQMAQERRAEEASHRPARAGGIPLRPADEAAPKPVKHAKKSQSSRNKGAVRGAVHDESREFVAIAPGSGKKKKKAQD